MSSTLVNALFTVESTLIMLVLLAVLIVLLVKRRVLAAVGMGVLVLERIVGIAWPFVASALDLRRDGILLASFAYTTITNILFLIGLGLILAQILVKRPADRLQGHP